MFDFLEFLQRKTQLISEAYLSEFQAQLDLLFSTKTPREEINRFYYQIFKGVSVDELLELGQIWFETVSAQEGFYHQHALSRLKSHQESGFNIVLVSGSGLAMLEPLADQLGVNAVLCAPQSIHSGKYTGSLYDVPCIGEGKAYYIREFFRSLGDVSSVSVAYGDDISDFPMLDSVAKGTLVSPLENVFQANRSKGYEILTKDAA